MKIAIIGSGYVGLVSGACFSDIGHDVVCVDNDPQKVKLLQTGGVPIFEPGLEKLIGKNAEAGRLQFTTDIVAAVSGADAVFIAVGTPPTETDGQADLGFVYGVANEIAPALSDFTVIVTKSTVPVGTGDEIERIIRTLRPDAALCVVSNPEFLREGAAIDDFLRPDRIVVGSNDERGNALMQDIYRPITDRGHELVVMDRSGAELTKYAANAFLATKITFINEIANLCEKVGTSVRDVSRGIGLDNRIGPRFLEAGPGYGGSCFPKDAKALLRIGEKYGAEQDILRTVISSNERRKRVLGKRLLMALETPKNKIVAVLGLTFKADTDDVRESPSLAIIEVLQQAGAIVRVSDPQGLEYAEKLTGGVQTYVDPYDAIKGADAVVVATECEQFRQLDLNRVGSLMRGELLADLRNIYDQADLDAAGLSHFGIGRPDSASLTKDSKYVSNAYLRSQPNLKSVAATASRGESDKTVLITGGAGFLGSHLAERLVAKGNRVFCLDNLHTGRIINLEAMISSQKVTFIRHDLINPLPQLPRFNEIYNLACPASPVHYQSDPVATLRVCSDGVLNVLNRAAQDNANVFHTSTSEVYGDPEVHPQPESYLGNVNPIGPRSCYDEGKRFAETLLTDFCKQNELRLRMVRIFNTYGPRMIPDDGRVVSNFIVQALRGEPITIYGDGSHSRSFCYVDDLIDGFMLLMAEGDAAQGPMNIGNPGEFTIGQLAEIILEMTGSRSEIVYHPLPIDDPQRRRPDISRAKKVLNWSPKISLEAGLVKTINYFERQMGMVQHQDYAIR